VEGIGEKGGKRIGEKNRKKRLVRRKRIRFEEMEGKDCLREGREKNWREGREKGISEKEKNKV
jgi:hypothetical protein